MRTMSLFLALAAPLALAPLGGCCFEFGCKADDECSSLDADGNGNVDGEEMDDLLNEAGLAPSFNFCADYPYGAGYGMVSSTGPLYQLDTLIDLHRCNLPTDENGSVVIGGVKWWTNSSEYGQGEMDFYHIDATIDFEQAEDLEFPGQGIVAETGDIWYPPSYLSVVLIPYNTQMEALGFLEAIIQCDVTTDEEGNPEYPYNCNVTVTVHDEDSIVW